jgi:UDP-glucose 4-epimerase
MKSVVVTGAAGFIGGQTVLKLLDLGYAVLAIDNQMPPPHLQNLGVVWVTGDFSGEVALDAICTTKPSAIIHCAGTSLVGPSATNPRLYYENNFVKTQQLVNFIIDKKLTTKFIFSSSAAVYGEPIFNPCQEIDPAAPISPYGQSKLMVEWLLESYHRAYGLDYVALRYFNACGADSQGRHGQEPGATHIIARVLEAYLGRGEFVLNGNDFETDDGTCVRDYVHVEDLADAHILAMDVPSGVYNLGTNVGHSNINVLRATAEVVKKDLEYATGPKRPGDPAILTAEAAKFMAETGWQPRFNLKDMVQHAWTWYNR